jgi:DNA ligase (NAD+)
MGANTRIFQLREELNRLNHQYYVLNASPVSDAEYDRLYRELSALEQEYPELVDPASPTQRVGAPLKSVTTVKHATKMLSLGNTFTAKDVLDFLGDGETVCMEPKIDGASLKLIYVKGKLLRAITRGDGIEGEEVTLAARTIKTIPLVLTSDVDIAVVGEVYMRFSVFNALNEKQAMAQDDLFANPRNAAAGSLKLKDPSLVANRNLSFVAYGSPTDFPSLRTQHELTGYLEVLGFQSVQMLPKIAQGLNLLEVFQLNGEVDLTKRIAGADGRRKNLDLPTDGLVFKIDSLAQQRDLGEGTKAPKYACAFKFPPERKSTKLLDIDVRVGKSGKMTPVAVLEPVLLSGTTVSSASLCNQDEIETLGINIGDIVAVEKSAEIIPKVMALTTKLVKGVWKMPPNCPCCETKLEKPAGMVDYFCFNRDCKEQVFARLRHACCKSALDIDGCGEALIREVMRHGVRSLADLFEIKDLHFLKPAARQRLEIGREKAKHAPYWRKLHALGIDGLGVEKCQELSSRWEDIPDALDHAADLKKIIGKVVFNELVEWFGRNKDEFKRLEEIGLNFERSDNGGKLIGKVFCITGTLMSGGRETVQNRITEAGGVVKSSVSRTVNFLVQGLDAGRTKTVAAEKHKVSIITEQQLYDMLGTRMPISDDTIEKEY